MSELSLKDYYDEVSGLLVSDDLFRNLEAAKEVILTTKEAGGRVFMAGNGGSAAIVSHAAVDFTKQAGIPAMTFNEVSMITALSNDYGYENWVRSCFDYHSNASDALLLVSVSGKSGNLVNAANHAKDNGHALITFTGKDKNNPLYELGDVRFFVDSKAYNIVEGLHMLWLTTIVDMIIGKSVYDVS